VSGKGIKVRILYPGKEVSALGEEDLKKAKRGEIMQMVRIGFGRVEKEGVIVFAHK
jgi:hypothetical protein